MIPLIYPKKIKRIVVWGITKPMHSHYYIHLGFYSTLVRLKLNVVWLSNIEKNNEKLNHDDFIICVNVAISNLKISNDYYYCFHNVDDNIKSVLDRNRYINLQVLTKNIDKNILLNKKNDLNLEGASLWDPVQRILYQSWGTPMLEHEFRSPVRYPSTKIEFFVGSIWNNELNQGNSEQIAEYKDILKDYGIRFIQAKGVSDFLAKYYIQQAAIASAIVGKWQQENGYTPCRVFKAISLGKIGSINSSISGEYFPWLINDNSIEKIITNVSKISRSEYVDIVNYQQVHLKNETYEIKIKNMLKALYFVD